MKDAHLREIVIRMDDGTLVKASATQEQIKRGLQYLGMSLSHGLPMYEATGDAQVSFKSEWV